MIAGVDDRRDGPVIAAPPDVADGRQGDEQRRHLGNPENQDDHRQRARPRHAGDQQTEADDDRLNEGDADHTLGDGADGGRRQFGEFRAARVTGDALEDGKAAAGCRLGRRP